MIKSMWDLYQLKNVVMLVTSSFNAIRILMIKVAHMLSSKRLKNCILSQYLEANKCHEYYF